MRRGRRKQTINILLGIRIGEGGKAFHRRGGLNRVDLDYGITNVSGGVPVVKGYGKSATPNRTVLV